MFNITSNIPPANPNGTNQGIMGTRGAISGTNAFVPRKKQFLLRFLVS